MELIQFLAALAIFHQDDFQKRMNRIKTTWWNGLKNGLSSCSSYHTKPCTTQPKWMFFHKLLFKTSLLLNGLCGIQVRPTNNSYDLCLLFCLYPSFLCQQDWNLWNPKMSSSIPNMFKYSRIALSLSGISNCSQYPGEKLTPLSLKTAGALWWTN